MPLSYKETSAPAAEPVTLAIAKQQLVIDESYTADDNIITGYITAARQYCERQMQRNIYNRTMLMTLDYFPLLQDCVYSASDYAYVNGYIRDLSIRPPKPGLVSVQSITYVNPTGDTITVDPSTYVVDTVSEPGRIMPNLGCMWPYQSNFIPSQVQVAYTSGTYGDGVEVDTCPQTIKLAIMLLVGHWYGHREATTEATLTNIPLGVNELLSAENFLTVY